MKFMPGHRVELAVGIAGIVLLWVLLPGESKPTPSNTHDKSDRGKIEEHFQLQPVVLPRSKPATPQFTIPQEWTMFPVAPVEAEPEPHPVVPSDDDTPTTPPLPVKRHEVPIANICTRHGGWKVETNNGRSWKCRFRKGNRH